ncbi:MAG: hypothetical protein ABI277_08410 [Burkholderiaceae bacterium]
MTLNPRHELSIEQVRRHGSVSLHGLGDLLVDLVFIDEEPPAPSRKLFAEPGVTIVVASVPAP